MFTVEFNDEVLASRLSQYEKNILPAVQVAALNESAFYVRDGFKQEFASVFKNPTPFTLNSILYTKATTRNLAAVVFVRDQSSGGVPPAKYLLPEATGGPRGLKPFERQLDSISGVSSAFYVPGRSLPLNSFGNVPVGVIRSILGQLKGSEKASTAHRRARRQAKRGGGGTYFMLKQNRGKLKAGVVYERIETGLGSAVRTVLFPVKQPSYQTRFDIGPVAQRLFNAHYPEAFVRWFNVFKVRAE